MTSLVVRVVDAGLFFEALHGAMFSPCPPRRKERYACVDGNFDVVDQVHERPRSTQLRSLRASSAHRRPCERLPRRELLALQDLRMPPLLRTKVDPVATAVIDASIMSLTP